MKPPIPNLNDGASLNTSKGHAVLVLKASRFSADSRSHAAHCEPALFFLISSMSRYLSSKSSNNYTHSYEHIHLYPQISKLTEIQHQKEENRLRAKALRDQHEAAARTAGTSPVSRTPSGFVATPEIEVPNSRKRTHDAITRSSNTTRIADTPATLRDGRANGASSSSAQDGTTTTAGEKEGAIRPARKFTKFVDYDFGKMTDTKGGFLSAEDDPWNKAMSGAPVKGNGSQQPDGAPAAEEKPKDMTMQEWERLQLLKKLRRQKAGPFEPGLSALKDEKERKKCRECGSFEIDFVWEEVFACAVCAACKEKMPEKYSLLTKTECREDYLLTERTSDPFISFSHSTSFFSSNSPDPLGRKPPIRM